MGAKHYTEEQKQFLKDNCIGKSAKELTDLFNSKFNTNRGNNGIRQCLFKIGIHNVLKNTGCFKKGFTPWNKGIKTKVKSKTMFKKGNIPKTTKPKWSERINKNGFVEIKIDDIKKWKLKHRYIYEQYHNINLSNCDRIIFLDGNNFNFDIDNLELITLNEQLIISHTCNLTDNKDINRAIINLSKLKSKISCIKNKKI